MILRAGAGQAGGSLRSVSAAARIAQAMKTPAPGPLMPALQPLDQPSDPVGRMRHRRAVLKLDPLLPCNP